MKGVLVACLISYSDQWAKHSEDFKDIERADWINWWFQHFFFIFAWDKSKILWNTSFTGYVTACNYFRATYNFDRRKKCWATMLEILSQNGISETKGKILALIIQAFYRWNLPWIVAIAFLLRRKRWFGRVLFQPRPGLAPGKKTVMYGGRSMDGAHWGIQAEWPFVSFPCALTRK